MVRVKERLEERKGEIEGVRVKNREIWWEKERGIK